MGLGDAALHHRRLKRSEWNTIKHLHIASLETLDAEV